MMTMIMRNPSIDLFLVESAFAHVFMSLRSFIRKHTPLLQPLEDTGISAFPYGSLMPYPGRACDFLLNIR